MGPRRQILEKELAAAKSGVDAAKQAVVGTFSGEFAARLDAAGPAAERTAVATEKTAEFTKKTYEEVRDGGVFA